MFEPQGEFRRNQRDIAGFVSKPVAHAASVIFASFHQGKEEKELEASPAATYDNWIPDRVGNDGKVVA